ncbi:superoxide dismutase family protein [Paludisphaera mucosa]|uniref:Superoxide dismutase family protein n=1 Tax=Paludisphaera mucosa TaxID=3030827 RepID=A0ABT6FJ07_9BACT|nr:superoxide dismutase family protein [Paludisphaera mucosa]MDG3007481.1 superoxide dismutase family protein [Paludisphaera mucosa]
MAIHRSAAALALCGLIGAGSAARAQHAEEKAHKAPPITKAVAVLIPTKNSKVEGRITFTEHEGKVKVAGVITGLTPGKHGFHVHEYGAWSEDGMASGGHFNPTEEKHAAFEAPMRHVGDLGNITADEGGKATIDLEDAHLKFHGPTSILGRGLVVHEKADDFTTQPSGNAGGRLAVGVVGVAKP